MTDQKGNENETRETVFIFNLWGVFLLDKSDN